MQLGEAYDKLKEIIFLAITNFKMFPDKEEYKSDHVILDKKTCTQDLKDFYFSFLELPKFKKSIDELETIVEKWAYFFKHATETKESELEKIIGSDEVIREAYQALDQFSWSPEELNFYEQEKKRELDAAAILAQQRAEGLAEGIEKGRVEGKVEGLAEGIERGRSEGVEQGRAEGQKNTSLAIAKKMLDQGIKLETIIQVTDLSEQEIASIRMESAPV